MNVDRHHKLIRRYTLTDAAVHDSQVLAPLVLPPSAGRDVWGDAAYRSQEIERQLKRRQLRSPIQYKGYRILRSRLAKQPPIVVGLVFGRAWNMSLGTR